jgi:crotonobetainyl-CoA:carnitine CoA-transferase CaiB-like acyl-CoA transferase
VSATDRHPLEGLEVVEICSAIAGPFVGKTLADSGAHVTKVEPPEGASYRNRPLGYDTHDSDELVYRFMSYNTGKDSVAIDLKTEEGAEILWGLIEEADVLVENMRSGAMARLGFEYEEMRERNPGLVYCSITGYGDEGPYRDWPAMDTTVQAVSGWADQIGRSDDPETMDVFAIDHVTALYAIIGVLTALVERGTTGEGQRVDVAMYDAAVSFLSHHLAEYSAAQNDPEVEAAYAGHFAPNGIFEAADGHFALYVPQEAWPAFCESIDREEFAAEGHPFATGDGRLEDRIELRAALQEVMRERTVRAWIDYFDEEVRRVVCAPVNEVGDVPEDPQVEARELVLRREDPELGSYWIPNTPFRFSRSERTIGDVPGLGEHTDAILGALGYDDDEIAWLRGEEVVN